MQLNKKIISELFIIFSLPIFILVIHIPLSFYDVYGTISWIDIPMHLIGGYLIGRSYFLFLKIIQRENYLGNMHDSVYFIFVISLVALTAVTWEFGEFVLDLMDNAMRQPNLANTMQDLFLGIIGGSFGFLIQRYIFNKNK